MPAVMKKGRAGNVISVIARHDDLERLAEMIMRETGSLGVRVFPSIHRHVAEREPKEVEVGIGSKTYRAAVKVSRLEGRMLNIKPEFEDCKRIALETGLPLRVVMKKWKRRPGGGGLYSRAIPYNIFSDYSPCLAVLTLPNHLCYNYHIILI
jgi:uncharacterized protein (DUF111 family)